MGVIEEIHEDLEADVDVEAFREAVEERVERMGGLADEETAAMLVAHELEDAGGEVEGIADVEAGMEEVKFVAKVVSVDELRTFERESEDEDDPDEGAVLNADVADETGQLRVAFWDGFAEDAAERMEPGDVLRIAGRPAEGYRGLEVNVDKAEPDPETEVAVEIGGRTQIEDLALGRSDVNVAGRVLDTESVRTFDRDDGSEGRVANLALGDPTGRVRVTLWDDMTEQVELLQPGECVEVVDGYVREREGDLELHVGDHGAIESIDEEIEYTPDSTPIEAVEIGDRVDLVGVVRSADPKRTFDRDDGSEGQVRNVRVQDPTDDIRVALWGEKADADVQPGDEIALADVEIQDGWQDDLEASAGWQSTVTILESGAGGTDESSTGGATDLSSFGSDDGDAAGAESETESSEPAVGDNLDDDNLDDDGFDEGSQGSETNGSSAGTTDVDGTASGAVVAGASVEFTGTVVQAGDPIIIDDGERTVTVDAEAEVFLGDEITVRGRGIDDDRIDADDVF